MSSRSSKVGASPYTTREYLRHLFAKVGGAGRGELVAALFSDGGD